MENKRIIRIGLLGFGTVGQGVWKHITNNRDALERRLGVRIELTKAVVANIKKKRGVRIAPSKLSSDPLSVVDDPKIDIVCELIGGTTQARDLTLRAMKQGKTVVTANKALICDHGAELFAATRKHGGQYFFEASVAGGIPIIKVLREGLVANRFELIYGILNGTSNYILTRMEREGLTFQEILKDARALGYVEADESLDLDGGDAAHKAVILAYLAHGKWIPVKNIILGGIRDITPTDISSAREFGYKIKLLAVIRRDFETNKLSIGVHPTLVPLSEMMASVDEVYNGISLTGDVAGTTLLVGRGAGQDATASSVISDIVDAISSLQGKLAHIPSDEDLKAHREISNGIKIAKPEDVTGSFYLRLEVVDEPGVLAKISQVFATHNVSIARMLQQDDDQAQKATLIITTHETNEKAIASTVSRLKRIKSVLAEPFLLRIFSGE